MGRSYCFECPTCGYRAKVSGRADRGLTFFVQTILCLDCRQLYDAVTRLRVPDEVGGMGNLAGWRLARSPALAGKTEQIRERWVSDELIEPERYSGAPDSLGGWLADRSVHSEFAEFCANANARNGVAIPRTRPTLPAARARSRRWIAWKRSSVC